MSVIRQQQTTMTDQECLADALKSLGHKVTINKEAEKIRGHYNEMSKEKCDIVLRKEDNGRQADIGFTKDEKGCYKLVTDTYVNRDLQNLEKFTNTIQVKYAENHSKKIAKKMGYTFLGMKTLQNGKTQLQFAKRG